MPKTNHFLVKISVSFQTIDHIIAMDDCFPFFGWQLTEKDAL